VAIELGPLGGVGAGAAAVPAADESVPQGRDVRPARRWFVWVLIGLTAAIVLFFVADDQGYLLGKGALFQPGLAALVVTAIVALMFMRPSERTQFCLTGIIALAVAVPINRISTVTNFTIGLFLLVIVAFTLVGVSGGRSTMSNRGRVLVGVLMGTFTVSTVLAGSTSGLIKLALSLAPALGAFLLAGRLDHRGRRNVAIGVVVLGGIEAALAIMEPVLFSRHLWASAQVQLQVDGLVAAPDNGILAGMERSQGTLGHALPLGFLLMVSLGLMLRVVDPPALVKWPAAGLFIAAVIFAGSRNSLILAVFLLLFYPSRKLTSVRLIWAALLATIMVVAAMITGQISLTFVDQFVASGSYTHRVGVLDAFGQLLSKQSLVHTLIGNGFGSIPSLFARGLLQTDGFNVVDNQFVAALAQGGLVAMITMVILTVTPLVVRDRYWRAAALVILVNCMVYDWFNWTSSAAIGFFVYGCAYAEMRRPPVGSEPVEARSTGVGGSIQEPAGHPD